MADFEWDLRKESRNIIKHGIAFTTASLVWSGPVAEEIDDRRNYGETRAIAFGEADGRVLAVVYTQRRAARRIISARPANSRERRLYEEEIRNRGQPPPN